MAYRPPFVRAALSPLGACGLLLAASLGVFAPNHASAQEYRTETLTVESTALGHSVSNYVCVPVDYDDHPDRRYPVMYSFPGTDARTIDHCDLWGKWFGLMDIDPVLVISVEGHIGTIPGSGVSIGGLWTNSPVSGLWEDYVMDEVIPAMDATYQTLPNRLHRIASGGSGGGYASIYYPLRRPNVFASGISQVGVNHFVDACDRTPNPDSNLTFRDVVLGEYSGPPYDFRPNGGYGDFMFAFAAAWSPNLNDPPYLVDLPYDENGNPVEEVCDRWAKHQPASMLHMLPPDPDLYFNFGLGTKDNLAALAPATRVLMDSLDTYGIPYDSMEYPCGHGYTCPDGDAFTLLREKIWNVNNLIARGALTISRAPKPMLLVQKELLNFGSVYETTRKTLWLTNYGPGELIVTPSSDSPDFVVDTAPISLSEMETVDLEVEFAATSTGAKSGTITLEHDGVGLRSFTLYGYRGSRTATETLPAFVRSIGVYPSPTAGPGRVEVEALLPATYDVRIVDLLGRECLVVTTGTVSPPGRTTFAWDASHLPSGTYFVRIATEHGTANRLITVIH
jgi:enterochelin esterase-like enzyme